MVFRKTAESGDLHLGKKGIKIWLLSTLTFVSLLHLIDAATAFLSHNPTRLLPIYPFINEYLTQLPIELYLWTSAASTFILWGITSLIAFDNPVEAFLNKMLSDTQQQKHADDQVLEKNSDFFDLMYETMEGNNEKLRQIEDLVYNVRAEVKDIQPVKETMEKTRTELTSLKKQVTLLEEKMIFPLLCRACGKPLRADFQLCPYCGEVIELQEMTLPKSTK
jgi:hypothetical protein